MDGKGEMKTGTLVHVVSRRKSDDARQWTSNIEGKQELGKSQQRTLRIAGQSVPVKVRLNPRARRLIVKVHPSTGEVAVVAPSSRSLPKALDFARQEGEWIADRLSRVPERIPLRAGQTIPYRGTPHVIRSTPDERGGVWIDLEADKPLIRVAGFWEHIPRRVEDWLRKQARAQITRRISALADQLGVSPSRITVRDAASRWGSCSSRGAISVSWRLIMAPGFVLNYVCAHEVAHLREMNHGRRFWRLVDELVGSAEAELAQAWLRDNGTELHRYAATED
jgi:predicted metal-dependent hydrolase